MIEIYHRTIKDQELKKISTPVAGSWIYIENPTPEELDRASTEFGLERDLLLDAVDPNEVPRAETEGDVTYAFTRVPIDDGNRIRTSPVLVGLARDFVFTVSMRPLPFIEQFMGGNVDFYTTQKSKLFTQIFFRVNATYNSFLTNINKRVRGTTVQIEKIQDKDILQFVQFESILNDFLAALVPTNVLLGKLLSGKFFKLYEEDQDLVEDLLLANGQLVEICRSNLTNIANIRGAYSTIMTNDLNKIIKLLTALTVVLTIPTMVASFYGMNVALPLEKSPYAFFAIAGGTSLVSVIILIFFIKKRWL